MKSSEIEELVISILAVIIAFVMVFAVQSCQNSATEDVWNNGICHPDMRSKWYIGKAAEKRS